MGLDRRKNMEDKIGFISSNIRAYRARMGYSQQDMADKLGVSRISYNDYEVNPQKLKVATLTKIADILNCNLEDFFVEFKVTERNI